MQRRSIFGLIDFLARKHRLDRGRYVRLFREPHEQFTRCAVDVIFRVVEQQVAGFDREAFGARGIPCEQLRKRALFHVRVVHFEGLPSLQVGRVAG